MEDLLTAAGLSDAQAATYLYLLKNGESTPPVIAKSLGLTRSNAYKVLDSLSEIGLIHKSEVNKKYVYRAEDPVTLTNLVAQERNRVIALEQNVREAMHELRAVYQRSSASREVRTYRGSHAVKSLYISQAKRAEPIYFIKTPADIPAMGTDTMATLRQLPDKQGTESYKIETDDYTAPVEWTASGDDLVIIDFEKEPSAIRIQNKVVAESFKELWKLLDNSLRHNTGHKKLPKQATRNF